MLPTRIAAPEPFEGRVGLRFRVAVWCLAAAWALLVHWPVLLGRVPLPAELLLDSPAWQGATSTAPPRMRHAEMGDAVTQGFPWYVERRERLLSGDLPLWNERALMGTPFLAASQPGVLDPLGWLLLPLPPKLGWSLSIALKSCLAFAFTAFAALRLGSSRLAAIVAGAIFSGSGFMTAWSLWSISQSALWLPAVLWATTVLHQRPDRRTTCLAAVTLALPVLGGHAEIAAFVTPAGALFALYLGLIETAASRSRRHELLGRFAVAALLSIGLAAAQLLPTLDWIGSLSRPSDRPLGLALPPNDLLGFVSRDSHRQPNSLGVSIPEGASYVGIAPLLLAPLALFARRRRAAFFALLGGAAAAVSYSLPPLFELFQRLPLLRAAPANRLLLLTDFSLALLAALALTELGRPRPDRASRRRDAMLLVLTAGAITSLCATALLLSESARRHALDFPTGLATTLLLLALLLGVALRAASSPVPARRRQFVLALEAVAALDVGTFAARHLPYFEPGEVFPEPPILARIPPEERAAYRLASVDSVLPVNSAQHFGFLDPVGYDYPLRSSERFLRPLTEGRHVPFFVDSLSSEKIAAGSGARLRLTNTRFVVASRRNGSSQRLESAAGEFRLVEDFGAAQLFEYRHALPRAWFVPLAGRRSVSSLPEALQRIDAPDFDPEREVVLFASSIPPPDTPAPFAEEAERESASGEIRPVALSCDGDSRHAALQLEEAGYVVVSEAFDRGWTAAVDGVPSRALRANGALLAVAVPAGARRLDLEYRPRTFALGAGISLAALALVVVALLAPPRAPSSERRSKPSGAPVGTGPDSPRPQSSPTAPTAGSSMEAACSSRSSQNPSSASASMPVFRKQR